MTARRTSIYSLRVPPPPNPVPTPEWDDRWARVVIYDLIAGLSHTGNPLQDSHVRTEDGQPYAAVGFRAAGDDEARRIATEVLDWADVAGINPDRCTLITGYGVHRRTVEF